MVVGSTTEKRGYYQCEKWLFLSLSLSLSFLHLLSIMRVVVVVVLYYCGAIISYVSDSEGEV